VGAEEMLGLQAKRSCVTVSDSLHGYMVDLIRKTRQHDALEYGASPRATLDLQRYAQAIAFVAERDFVLPDDIKEAARSVLPHRLISRRGVKSTTVTSTAIIDQILTTVPVPH
jgi:MoxR-like ATPase